MLLNPPEQPSTHVAIAWPVALLYQRDSRIYSVRSPQFIYAQTGIEGTNTGRFIGFLMPKITGGRSIFHIYNPVMRKQLAYPFDTYALYRTAANLCVMIASIHAKGYVIGDINESNILVNRDALVTIVDCDSFQVTDEQGIIHRCHVGKPEFTPPELQGVSFKEVDQSADHDLFGLGVLLFQLLMNGFHPFAGVLSSHQSVGRVDLHAIRHGLFPYAKNQPSIIPPPSAPPIRWLAPQVQALFEQCFVEGHRQKSARPTARQWYHQLDTAESMLQTCDEGDHIYSDHLADCPYCLQKTFKQAKQQFHFKTTNIPPEVITLMAQGVQAYQQKQPEQVLTLMAQAIESGYAPAEAYVYHAWAYQQLGDLETALAEAQYAVKLAPDLGLAHYVVGRCQIALKQYNEAVSTLTQALQFGLEDIYQAHYWRGIAQNQLALAYAQSAASLGDEYWRNLAEKTTAQAEADFKQVLHSPSDYWRNVAQEHLNQIGSTDYDALPVFTQPPFGISLREGETERIITVALPWWQRLGWLGLVLCSNGILLGLTGLARSGNSTCLFIFFIVMTIGCNWFFNLTMLKKAINRTQFTLDNQTLTITAGPISSVKQRYVTNKIQNIYCVRSLLDGKNPKETYKLVANTTTRTTPQRLGNLNNYQQIRYVAWKLRHYLNLSDLATLGEYIPGKRGKAHTKPLGITSLGFDFLILTAFMLICAAFPYTIMIIEYTDWQNLVDLQQDNHTVTGTVTQKKTTVNDNNKTYRIYYKYPIKTTDETSQSRESNEEMGRIYYNKITEGQDIDIIYAAKNPKFSRIADTFSVYNVNQAYGSYILWWFMLRVGGVIICGVILWGSYRIWLVYRLNRHGEVVTGVISDTKHRSWKENKNSKHAYDVYYRYLGYEARFNALPKAFSKISKGDQIQVCYLPHKPHISRPHPLNQYVDWWSWWHNL